MVRSRRSANGSIGELAFTTTRELLDRTKAAGALRPDIEVGDISLLLEQLQAVRVGDPQRTRQLRHRYLTLLVGGLHLTTADPLPGPPPTPEEVSRRYNG